MAASYCNEKLFASNGILQVSCHSVSETIWDLEKSVLPVQSTAIMKLEDFEDFQGHFVVV